MPFFCKRYFVIDSFNQYSFSYCFTHPCVSVLLNYRIKTLCTFIKLKSNLSISFILQDCNAAVIKKEKWINILNIYFNDKFIRTRVGPDIRYGRILSGLIPDIETIRPDIRLFNLLYLTT